MSVFPWKGEFLQEPLPSSNGDRTEEQLPFNRPNDQLLYFVANEFNCIAPPLPIATLSFYSSTRLKHLDANGGVYQACCQPFPYVRILLNNLRKSKAHVCESMRAITVVLKENEKSNFLIVLSP